MHTDNGVGGFLLDSVHLYLIPPLEDSIIIIIIIIIIIVMVHLHPQALKYHCDQSHSIITPDLLEAPRHRSSPC